METDTTTNYKHVGPCSLTHLFLANTHPKPYYIDAYKYPYDTLIFKYKASLQKLQLTILTSEDDSAAIGHCFQELELRFEQIVDAFRKQA